MKGTFISNKHNFTEALARKELIDSIHFWFFIIVEKFNIKKDIYCVKN